MKNAGVIVTLAVVAAVSAAALGLIAFKLARRDRQFQRAQFETVVKAECASLTSLFRNALLENERMLLAKLEECDPTPESLERLRRQSPLIKDVFMTDGEGVLNYPRAGSDFGEQYGTLFHDWISQEKNGTGEQADERGARKDETISSEKLYTNKTQAQFQNKPAKKQTRLLTTRFGNFIRGKKQGWIPWISGNQFCPLMWVKSRREPKKIVGAEVEIIALLSRLIPLMPVDFPSYYRFELIDSQGRVVCASNHDLRENDKVEPKDAYMTPIDTSLVPNWTVKGIVIPELLPVSSLGLILIMQIASFLLVLGACFAGMLWLMRRELILAGKKTSFVANVSHELKTPLTSIRMYAELLKEKTERIAPEKRDRYLRVILSESERLSRLISNVLDFSRIEAGRKAYHPTMFDVNSIIVEIESAWRPVFDDLNMRFNVVMSSSELTVEIDRDALVQVIQNLLSNAAKYAVSGGEATIESTQVGDDVLVTVSDRGSGIPRNSERKIFRQFYRCDDSLTAETSGSGLGLAIARKLMRDQGGDLVYRGNMPQGACFVIVLKKRGG